MAKVNTYLVYYKIQRLDGVTEGNKFYYANKMSEHNIYEIKSDLSKSHDVDMDAILIMNIIKLDD